MHRQLGSLRECFDESLRHVWLEDVYVGRMLRRLQLVEAFAADPRGFRGLPLSRMETLRKRYGLMRVSPTTRPGAQPLDPATRGLQGELWQLRGGSSATT